MFKKSILILALVAACSVAQAESTPAKKELVSKILALQQPGIEGLARALVEQPAVELMQTAGQALRARVAPEKQEAIAKEIQADARKYAEETVPLVRDRAVKLAPSTVGALLEERFSEEELRQVLTMMQSPIYNKFNSLGGEMQKVLTDKLVAETRGEVAPKVRNLEQTIAKRLGITAKAQAPASAPKATKK